MEKGFFAGSCSICHGIGSAWKIEESTSHYNSWKHQERPELDVTSASFLKLLSKLSRCTDSFQGQLRLLLVWPLQKNFLRRTGVTKCCLLMPNEVQCALLRAAAVLHCV